MILERIVNRQTSWVQVFHGSGETAEAIEGILADVQFDLVDLVIYDFGDYKLYKAMKSGVSPEWPNISQILPISIEIIETPQIRKLIM